MCNHVIVVDGSCVDCQAEVDAPSAEVWTLKPGKCAGCGREVKNGVSRGRGVACLPCWWTAIGGAQG